MTLSRVNIVREHDKKQDRDQCTPAFAPKLKFHFGLSVMHCAIKYNNILCTIRQQVKYNENVVDNSVAKEVQQNINT